MNLTPSFERESGQVILEDLSAGVAGEAPLVPVPGLDLAFDRADGRLLRAVADVTETDGPVKVDEQVAAMLIRLFGAEAPSIISGTPGSLSPEPGLAGTLSSLARLDAVRATSPVPPGSPWWGAEAAELAARAGLHARARAEARQAQAELLGRLDRLGALPEGAVRVALVVADIASTDRPEAARRLTDAIGKRSEPRPVGPPPVPACHVATEVENEQDRMPLTGPQWMLDPGLAPHGLFRLGLSPYSDLSVSFEGPKGPLVVEVVLAPGADCDALTECLARLVDPAVRRVLAQAGFIKVEPTATSDRGASRARAELQLPVPLDELPESWIEVVDDRYRPVLSAKGHRIRRALRWADTALRAERAPAGLDPRATSTDWARLAVTAWEHCRRDWAAAGDAHRARLAAQRCGLRPPAGGPAYLAEVIGW
jgi:hypothetical protein